MKILIIEDEKTLAESIGMLLESRGFQVELAFDGEIGVQFAELRIYDLVILDVMMPGLNGLQVAKQIRANRCTAPILMLTARSSLEDRIAGLDAGADYYLTKPFDSRELVQSILSGGSGTQDEWQLRIRSVHCGKDCPHASGKNLGMQ